MKHPLCRPPRGAIEVRKLTNLKPARFAADDGKPGLAFFGIAKAEAEWPEEEQAATVWVAHCKCKVHADCPVAKALDKACDIYESASIARRPKA